MAVRVKGITITINGDATAFKRELREAKAEATMLTKYMKELDKALKLNPTSLNNIVNKQQALNAAIRQQKELLSSLTARSEYLLQTYGKFENMTAQQQREMMSLQNSIQGAKNKLAELTAESAAFGAAASATRIQWENSLGIVKKNLDDLAKAFVPVTAAATALAGVSVYLAADYESAFAGVRKTVDATEEQFGELYDKIIEFSTKKPISASDVAYIAELGGQLGIATENLTKFADVIADISVSTDLELEDAATQLAQFMNIMQSSMSYDEIDRLGAVIADLGNNSATTESAIVSMAMRIAGTAGNMGASAQEVMALATSLSSLGIKAEMGGNAISTIMRNIDNQVQTSGGNVQLWADIWSSATGRAASEFQDSWGGDVMSTLSEVIEGLGKYKDDTGSLTVLMDDLDISYMRQVDTMNRLAGASGTYTKYLNMANRAWDDNSALVNEANQRYATTESKLKIMLNDLSVLGITIGNDLLPFVNAMADGIGNWALEMSKMDDGTRSAVEAIGLMAIASAPTAKVLSTVAGGLQKGSQKARELGVAFSELATYFLLGDKQFIHTTETLDKIAAGAQRAEKAMAVLRASLHVAAFAAAATAIAVVVSEISKLSERSEKSKAAANNLKNSYADAFGAMKKGAKEASDEVSGINDLIQKQIDLAKTMKDRYKDMLGTLTVVDDALVSVDEYLGMSYQDMGTDGLAKLENALENINSELGINVELVADEEKGYLILADGVEVTKDKLLELIQAKKDDIALEVTRENYKDTLKHYKETAEAYEANANGIEEMNKAEEAWLEAVENGSEDVNGLFQAYAALEGKYGDIANAYRNDEREMKYLKDAMNFLADSANKVSGSMGSIISGSELMQAAIKSNGWTLSDFKKVLEETGVSTEAFATLSDDQLALLVGSYDGNIGSIYGILAQFAEDSEFMGTDAGQRFAASLGATAQAAKEEAMKVTGMTSEEFDKAAEKAGVQGEYETFMFAAGICSSGALSEVSSAASKVNEKADDIGSGVDTYTSGTHLIQNFAQGIRDAADWYISSATDYAMRQAAAGIQFSVPKEGPFSGAERGGWRSGTHLIQNWAQGMRDATPELLKAAVDAQSAILDVIGREPSMPLPMRDMERAVSGMSLAMSGEDGINSIVIQNLNVNASDYKSADQFVTMLRRAAMQYA